MSKPVRWGILGASKFAREHMGPAIHAARGAEFAALATSDPGKARAFEAFAPGLAVHDRYDALLSDPTIDAVYIPLPNHLHVEWTKEALAAGKHVLCEKPIALTAAEIDGLKAERDATGLLAAEAYMIVHHPQWQRLRALLAQNVIGELRLIEGVFAYDNPDPSNIRNRAETGGGSLRDIGVYTCGGARFATGIEPSEVACEIEWESGVDVTAHVTARFGTARFTATTSMRMHLRQEMTFHGTEGVLRLTAPFNPGVYGEARLERHDHSAGTLAVERFPKAQQYVLQVEAFGEALRGGARFPWSLEDAQGTQSMIDAAYAAARRPVGDE